MDPSSSEKSAMSKEINTLPSPAGSIGEGAVRNGEAEHEVFSTDAGDVNFRTITWQRLLIILVKIQIATGVLSIPSAMGTVGAVPGALLVVGWQSLNTYTACIMYEFRNEHHCHNIMEICGVMWGRMGYELVNVMFIVAFVLCTGSGLLGTSIAFNALSEHGACSVWFSFVSTCLIICFSSIRKFDKMTWPMTGAFLSVMGGILAVVVGVTLRDRPAAAPVTGDFDLGFKIVASPTFAAGITAAATMFISSASGPGSIPVIAEMRRPQDYLKAVIPVNIVVASVYLSLSMVVYYYCGQWIATPSLGSAGPLIKKIAYGIALPSLVVSAGIFNHVSSKTTFVRLMRDSPHLQSNTWQHWTLWIGLNVGFGFLAFVAAEAIPVFNYILALAGSVCFAPMSLMFPALAWMYDIGPRYKKAGLQGAAWYGFHVLILLVGTFMTVGGVYGTAISIKSSATMTKPFSCADNSNTVV